MERSKDPADRHILKSCWSTPGCTANTENKAEVMGNPVPEEEIRWAQKKQKENNPILGEKWLDVQPFLCLTGLYRNTELGHVWDAASDCTSKGLNATKSIPCGSCLFCDGQTPNLSCCCAAEEHLGTHPALPGGSGPGYSFQFHHPLVKCCFSLSLLH